MVKILYGVNGEGLGHASRSRILINYLKKNHEIKVVAGGKAYKFLSENFDFVTKIESARMWYKNNRARVTYSVLQNLYKLIVKGPSSYLTVKKIIKNFKPDVIITDSEPVSHFAAKLNKIKRISIDNPQALTYRKYKVNFGEYLPWFGLRIIAKTAIYGADKYIIYDFSDEQINNPWVLFLKPLIQDGILKQKPSYKDHIFVYQTSESARYLFEIFKKFDEKFVIYGFNINKKDENLVFKKFNEDEFYRDIATSKAIITNGGFTVISEALYLKKPILSLPIIFQFEQILNGKFVEQLEAGEYHMKLDEIKIRDFMKNLEKYKKNLKSYNSYKQEEILKIIEKEILKLISSK